TISNAIFVYLGIYGLRSCMRNGHSAMYACSFVGYMIVGLTSILFHMTMKCKYPAILLTFCIDPFQLADELSMVYATSIMSFVTFAYGQDTGTRIVTFLVLLFFVVFVTAWYVVYKNPIFHQVAFGVLMAATVFRAAYATGWELRPALQARNPKDCERIMKELRNLVVYGVGVFVLGFAIWNLDNIHCENLRHARHIIQLPWGVVLEGHSWWHIFTGLAYCEIVWGIWLRRCLQAEENEYEVQWKYIMMVPIPSVEKKGMRRRESEEKLKLHSTKKE
ncbi:hypothetical protein TD95_003362, partial [Thielaviopsis punctulata]